MNFWLTLTLTLKTGNCDTDWWSNNNSQTFCKFGALGPGFPIKRSSSPAPSTHIWHNTGGQNTNWQGSSQSSLKEVVSISTWKKFLLLTRAEFAEKIVVLSPKPQNCNHTSVTVKLSFRSLLPQKREETRSLLLLSEEEKHQEKAPDAASQLCASWRIAEAWGGFWPHRAHYHCGCIVSCQLHLNSLQIRGVTTEQ